MIIVGIQIMRGKREVPTGKPYIVEVVIAFLVAVIITWVVDWGMETLTKVSMEDLTSQLGGMSKEEEQKIKEEAEAYLKDKYGKEIYVDQIEYIWQVPVYTMRGHLKGDKDSSFLVEKKKGEYTDSYFLHKISGEGREEIKPYMEEAFDPIMNWNATVGVADQERERLESLDLSYPELRQETNQYRQQIKVNVPVVLTESNKAEELEKAYQLIEQLNQNEIMANIEIFYYDPSIKEKEGLTEMDFTRRARYGDYVTAILEVKDVSQVTSAQDLNGYLEIYK